MFPKIAYNPKHTKERIGLFSSCLILLIACSSLGSDEDLNPEVLTTNYVESELWLENAKNLILKNDSEYNNRILYAELPSENLNLEIVLNQFNEVSKVNIPITSECLKILHFEYGRLSFAETRLENDDYIISAYAHNRPYAHSFLDGKEPEFSLIKEIDLSDITIRSILTLAEKYSLKEKKAAHQTRITQKVTTIRDSVSLNQEYTAVINLKEGEKLDIQLQSREPHVYFTISPSMGSDMEHKFWRGRITTSGDISIRVFAAEDVRNGQFRLDIKRL